MDIEKFLAAFPPIEDGELHAAEAQFTDRTGGRRLGVIKDVHFRRLYTLFVLADESADLVAEKFDRLGKRRPSNKALLRYRILEENREMLAYAIRIAFLRYFGTKITDEEWMADGFGWAVREGWTVWWDLTGHDDPNIDKKLADPAARAPSSSLQH
jgi:hypothetical protein